MNENNEQSGGLFSDDYEAPKRENPYLKKNRDKAKAERAPKEKKPRRTAETDPAPASERDQFPKPADKPTDATPTPPPAEEESSTHKRSFSDWYFEHVKLIVAIVAVLLVLSLVLITDVVEIVTDLVTQSEQEEKEGLTLNYVKGLTLKSEPITWNDLDKFRRDESEAKDSVTWMIPVKGTDYELWISGVSTDKAPSYIYLYHMRTGDRLVIGEEDFDLFIGEHS